jgi:hypothetical protein
MTAKEKAVKLLIQYDELLTYIESKRKAKDCVLIAVEEMINMCKLYHNHNVVVDTKIYTELSIDYWEQVKQEIENL